MPQASFMNRGRGGGWTAAVGLPLLAIITVAAVAWLAYSPILDAYFRDDDFWWLSTARAWDAGTLSITYAPAGVAPIYNIIYRATYEASGLNPRPYFALLLLCHALNSCLVMLLVWLLTTRLLASWSGGLLFALLFCHHEAVAWPAGGPHVFTAFSILVALICWVEYRRGVRPALAASVLFGVIAVFTKDSGVTFVPMLLALDFTVFRKSDRRALVWQAIPLLGLLAWRLALPPTAEPITPGSADYGSGAHMLSNLIFVVPQMAVPDLRFANYLHLLQRLLPAPGVAAALVAAQGAILLLSALAVWGIWRGRTTVRLAIIWCYVGFLPFVPFSYDYARAPRYLYIPSIGLALLVGVGVAALADRLRSRPALTRTIAVAVGVAYLAGSFAFARLVCDNRLRDSRMRRAVFSQIIEHVPAPGPGTAFYLTGLPSHLLDVAKGLPLFYSSPITATVGPGPPPPGTWFFRFDSTAPGTLIEFCEIPGAPRDPASHAPSVRSQPPSSSPASARTPPSGPPDKLEPSAAPDAMRAPSR